MSNNPAIATRNGGAGAKRPVPTPARRPSAPKLQLDGIGPEVRQLAAAILEVLAGVRTPPTAAQQLGISLPRYYALELRALQALVAACAPRPRRGRIRSPANELAALHRECDRLRRDCARQQTLLRAAQRTIGLPPPPAPAKPTAGKKRRQRKPTARALKAARLLQQETPVADISMSVTGTHPS
jgi:hypothetical protein